jgi:hypothetical protein
LDEPRAEPLTLALPEPVVVVRLRTFTLSDPLVLVVVRLRTFTSTEGRLRTDVRVSVPIATPTAGRFFFLMIT